MEFNPELENNNPFAEPEAPQAPPEALSGAAAQAEPAAAALTAQQPPAREPQYTPQRGDAGAQPSGLGEAGYAPGGPGPGGPGPGGPAAGSLSQSDLRQLIPERFAKSYLMQIKLRSIEPNKAANPILNFDVSVTGLARFRQHHYAAVRRTFNEVLKFNRYLAVSNLEVCVPVVPLAVTSYPPGGAEETRALMVEWQEWFDRVCANPILIRDEEFVFFVESDFGYAVINSGRKTAIASGLMRRTLKQFQVPYDPIEELADFRPVIKGAYLVLQRLHKALERKLKVERAVAAHTADMAAKMVALLESELVHPGMKNMWDKLAKVTSVQADLGLVELVNDMGSLGDGLVLMAHDFYQTKEALTNRHLVMRELAAAERDTRLKHAHATKVKARVSLDPLRVDEAVRALEYAAKTEELLRLQLKRILGEMLFERTEIVAHTDTKLRRMLQRFTLNKVEHHRKVLKHLEGIRLDVRLVDERGGLLRLNRDNLSTLKHNLAQSQLALGDLWTQRTFRLLDAQPQPDADNDADVVDARHAASLLGVATF